MQQYIGTKIVKVQPMTRLEYNDYRGWDLPEDEQDKAQEAGMLVEYADNTHQNVKGHAGYVSWSPLNVFADTYILINDGSDYAIRLHNEFGVLTHKLDKLKNFILSGSFETLPEVDRIDLREQLMYMDQYHQVLMRRVSRSCGNA